MKNVFGKGNGLKKVAGGTLVFLACAAFVVPTLLVAEAVRRLNVNEAEKTDEESEQE